MAGIILGHSEKRKVEIDLDILLRTRLLVQANSGGGKSWLIRRLAEQVFGRIPVLIIDPEGEFATLRERYGYVLVGKGGETPADPRSAALVAERLLQLRASAVCDLYEAFRSRPSDRRLWVRRFLEAIIDAPKSLWRPLVVIVDEAHKFCPQETPKAGSQSEREAILGCKEAMISLATTGRKRGFCSVWATQRLAKLDKDASAELLNRLIGPTFEDVDIDRAVDLLSVSRDERHEFKKMIRVLEPGHFFAIGRAVSTERVMLQVGPVGTTHPEMGSARFSQEPPPTPEKVKALLPKLSDLPKEAEEKARTEAELRTEIRSLKGELTKAKHGQAVQAAPKTVEVPALKNIQIRRFEGLSARLERAGEAIGQVGQEVVKAGADIRIELQAVLSRIEAARRQGTAPVGTQFVSAAHQKRTEGENRRVAPDVKTRAASVSGQADLGKGERIILTAVAQYPEGASREQLTILTGYRRSSRDTYLQRIRQAGLVEDRGGFLVATGAGLASLGVDFEPLPTGETLRAYWMARLPEGERRILAVVLKAHPKPVDREAIDEATGYKRSSRDTYIQRLLARRLVEAVGRGEVRAAEVLFQEG